MSQGRRLTGEQIDQMAAWREAGKSYEWIGKRLGLSAKGIRWQCLRVGADHPEVTSGPRDLLAISVHLHTGTKKGPQSTALADYIKQNIPAGYFGEPSDIGHLVAFLASPLARYINSAAIPVDGGAVRQTL